MKNLQPAKYIEIRNEENKTVAFLSPQADGVRADTATIDNELNGNCQLNFELPLTSDKWQYITDAHTFVVNGKYFILLKPDTEEIIRDGQKVWGKVTAQEKWIELDKKYATISNDPTMPQPKQWSDIIIVSGGFDLSGGRFPVGSAGHALCALLQGTGWTVETVDVTGTFDLESLGKESVLANIKKVQDLWGGFLVWDSINKTVSLRSESAWQNYTGFQIRYAKNLKGITRTVNRDLVTRLYPFGKDDLNIGAVNGGVLYLENFTYTDKVYEGTYQNQDIVDQTELKAKGIEELVRLCKPRYSYQVTMLDLSVKPEWAHETFSCGDMVDVIDDDVKANDRLRIVRHKYNVFQPWKCEIEVGEPLEKLANRIADNSKVAEKILANSGTSNILKGIINTKATEINGASGDYSLVDGVSTWWGSANGVRNGKVTRITPNGLIISDDGGQTWGLAIDGSGVYANKVVVSDVYALSTDDGYTKMGGSGISVMDASNVVKAFLGQYERGKFGLVLDTGAIKIQKSGVDQFYADSNGDLHLSGKLDAATGTFSGVLSAATGSFSGTISAGTIQGSAITGGSININNKFLVDSNGNFMSSSADITGRFQVKHSDGTMLADVNKNNYGGLLYVYDANGYVDTKMGVEAGTASNVSGTFLIFNDLPTNLLDESMSSYLLKYQRVTAGVQKGASDSKYSYGGIQVKAGYRHDTDYTQTTGACTVYIQGGEASLPRGQITLYEELGYTGNYGYTSAILGAGHPGSATEVYKYGGFLKLNAVSGSLERVFIGVNSFGDGYLQLYKSDNTISTKIQDNLAYFKNANVGIRTATPLFPLHVEGQSKLNGNIGVGCDPILGYALAVSGATAMSDSLTVLNYIKASEGFQTLDGQGITGTYTLANITSIMVSGGIITSISTN